MASAAITSAGTTIGISASLPATYNTAGFGALTFTEIGEVTDIPEFGRVYNLVTHNPLGDRRTVKRKGSFNDGSVALSFAYADADAGQILLATASDDDDSYAFAVTIQDGTIFYFSAQVMGNPINIGNVDQITGGSATLEIDNDIIKV